MAADAIIVYEYTNNKRLYKAGMIATLDQFDRKEIKRRKSSPRLMVYDTSLMTALSEKGRAGLMGERDLRGRVVESAVGAYLLGRGPVEGFEVYWWRETAEKVDFVLQKGTAISAIEVKSGGEASQSGMMAFLKRHPEARRIVVGGASSGACGIEDYLAWEVPLFW